MCKYFGSVPISIDPKHSTPLEGRVLDIVNSIDISRLWREGISYLSRTLFAPAEQYVYRKMYDKIPHSSGVLYKKTNISEKSILCQKLYTPFVQLYSSNQSTESKDASIGVGIFASFFSMPINFQP